MTQPDNLRAYPNTRLREPVRDVENTVSRVVRDTWDCGVCKDSDPECDARGVPANCALWGKSS